MQSRALLSAHRGAAAQLGLRDNSWESLEAAVALPVDYVEFDVHRTRDGEFVLHHLPSVRDAEGRRRAITELTYLEIAELTGQELVRFEDALALLRANGKLAHIDFKFSSPWPLNLPPWTSYEEEAAEIALRVMEDPTSFILTSLVDESVRLLRDWADVRSPGTLVGLSLGLGEWRLGLIRQVKLRASEVFPARRLERCRANLVVVQHRLADVRVLRWAARKKIPVLVWTVDEPRKLKRFMQDQRVWMVTSNHPARASVAEETIDVEAVA
ncbi:glycerophosphodiester phosphodiesterase [Nocardioides sp. KR10-350]|uniref:glycerophosphodiester phosphodiesterase n=1 Tax=Nocardioides cheoyonin TaxID=3156615 RepID=UPI0032B42844